MPPRAEDHGDRSIRTAESAANHPAATAGHAARWAAWEREQAALERLHALRSMAPGAVILAAALPFLIAVAKEMATAEGGAAFASLGSRTAGIGLAVACAGVLAPLARRATTRTGLAWLVLGAYLGGIAGLAVARGLAGL